MILISGIIHPQSESQIKQAKEMISKSGMSKKQVIDAAKKRGYSESQIDAVLEKDGIKNKNPDLEQLQSNGLPSIDQSNNLNQVLENSNNGIVDLNDEKISLSTENIGDQLSIVEEGDLEIVEDENLRTSQTTQSRRNALSQTAST